MKPVHYSGTVVSLGMAKGEAFVITIPNLEKWPYTNIPEEEVEGEVGRLWAAVETSLSQLRRLSKKVKAQVGESESKIFEAHAMILRDAHLGSNMAHWIEVEKVTAETAVVKSLLDLIRSFRGHGGELRKKFASDLKDLGTRLIKNLSTVFTYDKAEDLDTPCVVVARELTLSVVSKLDRKWILGFVTESGSQETHAGIFVRSLGVPAVSEIQDVFEMKSGDHLFLDGRTAEVWVNPPKKIVEIFEKSYQEHQKSVEKIEKLERAEPITKDGLKIDLFANVWLPGDLEMAEAVGAQGLGVIRTEFIYLLQSQAPSEEELYQYHKEILDKVWAGSACFRLLDVGGEMDLPESLFKGRSSQVGLKFLVEEKNIFKSQLKAIMRAALGKSVQVVYPFLSDLADLKTAHQLLMEVKEELHSQKIGFSREVKVGVLIETLQAVNTIDEILKEVSFVILGSNDLSLSLKGLERISSISLKGDSFLTPLFLRTLHQVFQVSQDRKKDFYFSGEMAEDLSCMALFIGLGLRSFNVASSLIPRMRKWICSLDGRALKKLFQEALTLKDEKTLQSFLQKSLPPFKNFKNV